MIFRYPYQGGVWIDLEQPSEDEMHQIAQELSLSERIEKELVSPTPIPLVASDDNMALLVLHFPTHGTENEETESQEIDFVVGTHFILTVRYEVIAPLHHLKKQLETRQLMAPHALITADVLFEILFVHLYTSVRDHINHVVDQLARVERDMFNGSERTTVRSISSISRQFLHMEAALADQEEPLGRFLLALKPRKFFHTTFAERAEHISAERTQIARLVTTYRAVAGELRETNNALLSTKQNEIIKILTVVSFIFLPLALVAKIFAMKVEHMPFVDDPNGFWIILGFMSLIALLLIFFVAKKRWI